jgi:hypothetical protein
MLLCGTRRLAGGQLRGLCSLGSLRGLRVRARQADVELSDLRRRVVVHD